MRRPTWLPWDVAPAVDPLAVWHEVGRRVTDDVAATVYRTTPIGVGRPARGATEAAVTCCVCREPVRVRVLDPTAARRRRILRDVLGWGQYLLAPLLLGAVATVLASLGLRLGSGLPGVLAWLVVVLPVLLAVLGVAEWAERRADGVTILRGAGHPGPGVTHRIGSGRSAVVTLPARAARG